MSFILDALKKSEHARQRQAGPALFEVKVVQPRRTVPIWAVIIVLLVLINVMTLGWIVLSHRHGKAKPPATSSVPSAIAVTPTASLVRAPTPGPTSTPASPSVAQAQPATVPALAPTTSPASTSAPQGTAKALGPSAANGPNAADFQPALQAAASAPPSGPTLPSESLPLYAQIAAEPGSTLPRLHLDLHVYSPVPSKRFVMINMHKLHQGDALPDGVSVVTIRPDGVVLSYHGHRFLLPR